MKKKDAVPYDKRTGFFVSRGTDYGVGKPQPIGPSKPSDKEVIPCGRNHDFTRLHEK